MTRETGVRGGRRNKRGRKEKENEEGEEIVIFSQDHFVSRSVLLLGSHVEFPSCYVGEYWFSQYALAMSTVMS